MKSRFHKQHFANLQNLQNLFDSRIQKLSFHKHRIRFLGIVLSTCQQYLKAENPQPNFDKARLFVGLSGFLDSFQVMRFPF